MHFAQCAELDLDRVRGQKIVLQDHLHQRSVRMRLLDHGAHAYVSPRWYADKERVPTWNYAAVHAYGKVRAFHEAGEKRAAVAKLIAHHDPQWQPQFERLSAGYMEGMLGNIVAFEVEVARLETRWKLSQNRGRPEMELIVAELDKSAHPAERELAGMMRKHLV